MDRSAEFYEVQKYTQWWLWTIVLASVLFMMGINIRAGYQQFILQQPWGDEPMSDVGLAVFIFFTTVIVMGLIWIFAVSKLETKIDKWGIYYRYFPLVPNWKFIPKENIKEWKVKKYVVLGYGIRLGFGFITLNVKGNMGLELRLYTGRNLRLGTQLPQDVQHAMQTYFTREET